MDNDLPEIPTTNENNPNLIPIKIDKKKVEWIEREYNGKTEKFAIRRSFDGWRVVYPLKNEDGTNNWKNVLLGGSWGKMLNWILILLIILAFFYVYDHDTKLCRNTLTHLNETCAAYKSTYSNISLSDLTSDSNKIQIPKIPDG